MEDYELFSARQKTMNESGQPKIYQYDELPQAFREQVIHIWNDAIGFYYVPPMFPSGPYGYTGPKPMNEIWDWIRKKLSVEYGVADLGGNERNSKQVCKQHLRNASTEMALDVIELTFRAIDIAVRELGAYKRSQYGLDLSPDEAIDMLNKRFRQHGIGYRFENGQLIKMASDHMHEQVTVPAIQLLSTEGFAGPSKEFMTAHEHYRYGRYDSAIGEASNALESTIKTIFEKREIVYEKTWPANRLIMAFFRANVVPSYLESSFANLVNILQGVPTIRSKESAHGEGAVPRDVPSYLAEYALNATAAAILFFVRAHLSKK